MDEGNLSCEWIYGGPCDRAIASGRVRRSATLCGECSEAERAKLHEPFAAWVEAALADGWEEIPGGVWGTQVRDGRQDPRTRQLAHDGRRLAGDRTVQLVRDGGEVKVWLVDRAPTGDPFAAEDRRERWMDAWTERGLRKLPTIPGIYRPNWWVESDRTCNECGKVTDATLRPLGFASRVCPSCDTPELRAKVEPPGWAN